MSEATHVSYGASIYGYEVQVIDGNTIIETYSGGNIPECGTTRLNPHLDATQPQETLLRYAKEHAFELAEEQGVPKNRVGHNTDIDEDLIEEDGYYCRKQARETGAVVTSVNRTDGKTIDVSREPT